MGKVHDGYSTSEAGLAQWIWRKLRNHDPLSVQDDSTPRAGVREELRMSHLSPTSNAVRYALNDGRVFEVTVTQVQGKTPVGEAKKLRVPV